ncbi:MAG: phenylalanine--tRNA ligase subunit alpha [Acidimicrobiia bacterium]|nr:MAG: phenylalanine--tRNA ligase subunit alpha [Acidimicrobiia bacterium]
MTSAESLHEFVAEVLRRLDLSNDAAAVAALETEALGAESPIVSARRSLKDLPEEARRVLGKAVHESAERLRTSLGARRAEFEAAELDSRLAAEWQDLTLPAREPPRGAAHLVRQVWDEVVDIFVGLGYTVASGPEVDTDYHNFRALNYPDAHPARLESDTLYVDHGDDPEGVLLRTQTSTMQVRWMESHDPPVYVVAPGRVYRRETADATHTPVFHQIEGLVVDEGITFAHLKGTLQHLADEIFGSGRRLRFLPHFFPFTEPSAELHVSCFACDGSGCRICSGSGWIELLGCGMVDPAVLSNVGYDPALVTGFAFGMGLDRLAMMRYGVPELRHFFTADRRVLEQYR